MIVAILTSRFTKSSNSNKIQPLWSIILKKIADPLHYVSNLTIHIHLNNRLGFNSQIHGIHRTRNWNHKCAELTVYLVTILTLIAIRNTALLIPFHSIGMECSRNLPNLPKYTPKRGRNINNFIFILQTETFSVGYLQCALNVTWR